MSVEEDVVNRDGLSFGTLLRNLRLARGLTQEELAERAGLSVRGISDLERGQKLRPRTETLTLLGDALDLSGLQRQQLEAAGRRPPGLLGSATAFEHGIPPHLSRRHNLPAPLTSFVGRERELAEVIRILPTTRLLTLVGAAGVGKTRFAQQVAATVLDQYRDGIWLVELAPLADPLLVPKTVAAVLALPETPGRRVDDSLVDALRPKQLLLVLDNCEHLVQKCAELVAALLRACPDLRVLATSRQSLHVAGEIIWRVPSLTLPPPGSPPSKEMLATYDATGLFVERAGAALPSFAASAPKPATILRICARLDGIPLAIELAAARVTALGVDQIEERLGERFRLLVGGSRADLPRQQTLRATLDWSFGLLSEPERVLFRRLAVFVGGWSLDAAETVGGGDGLESDTVLNLLADLVDKSLVVADATEGSVRYRLLETMREYGREKLRATGEDGVARDRHGAWFLALAEEADRNIRGPEQVAWLSRLECEHDNLRAALAWWLADEHDSEAALRLAGALAWFWRMHGHLGEGRHWLDRALDRTAASDGPARPHALSGAGFLAYAQNDLSTAMTRFEAAFQIAERHDDWSEEAWALHGMGRLEHQKGNDDRAAVVLTESLNRFRAHEDVAGCGYSLYFLARVARSRGEHEKAMMLYDSALDAGRKSGDTWLLGSTLMYQGSFTLLLGDINRAAGIFRESLILLNRIAAIWPLTDCLWHLAIVMGAQSRLERAARLFGAAQALFAKMGIVSDHPDRAERDRGMSAARSRLGDEQFNALAAEGQAMALDEMVAYALGGEDTVPPDDERASRRVASSECRLLTAREREVAKLITRGYTNRQVASALVITPRTVDTHVTNIFGKLGLHSRAQVAAWAAEHGLLAKSDQP